MEISTSALPTVAAERATMFVALELSKSIWLVALHSPISDKVSQHRFAGGDVDGLLALIARKQAQAEAGLGQTIRILSCYEAGYDGFWLHRLLCARGIDNRVLDAASILVDRRSRRAKTDRLDAAGLLRTLMALDRGESRVCRVVRVPGVAEEDERRRSRERGRLVVERGQHSSRIKGLLRSRAARPRNSQVRQSPRATNRDRTRLAVAATPTGQQPGAMVPRTRRYGERARATDHARGVGTQADGRLVAILERGAGSRWRGTEGVSKFRSGGDQHAVRDDREGRGPVAPRALMPSKRWVPSASTSQLSPSMRDMGAGSTRADQI